MMTLGPLTVLGSARLGEGAQSDPTKGLVISFLVGLEQHGPFGGLIAKRKWLTGMK